MVKELHGIELLPYFSTSFLVELGSVDKGDKKKNYSLKRQYNTENKASCYLLHNTHTSCILHTIIKFDILKQIQVCFFFYFDKICKQHMVKDIDNRKRGHVH